MEHPSKQGWLMLGGVWYINFFLRVLTMGLSPLLPVLIADFGLSHGMGGTLYAIPTLIIALLSYPLGILTDRLGVEIMVGLGFTIAVLASLLRALSGTFLQLALFTGMLGLGFALCYPNLPKLVKEYFPARLTGTATGIYTTAMPLGVALGISLTMPLLVAMQGWRGVFAVWSLMAVPGVIYWWVVARKKSRPEEQAQLDPAPAPESGLGASLFGGASKSVITCGLLLSFLNLIFFCSVGWLPTFLGEQGWKSADAATATSLITYAELPSVFLIPVISDRIGRRRLILILCFLIAAVCSAVISFRPALSWWITPVFGFAIGGIFGLILALPVVLVERQNIGRAAGAIISIGYVGGLVGPPLAGYLRDLTGQFAIGFLMMAFAGLVAMFLAFLLPEATRMSPPRMLQPVDRRPQTSDRSEEA